jgi:hypothetical protein
MTHNLRNDPQKYIPFILYKNKMSYIYEKPSVTIFFFFKLTCSNLLVAVS